MKTRERIAFESDMESLTTIVLHFYRLVSIIKRRQEERITHDLSPMLPASIKAVVIIIILSTQMVRDDLIMVMVHRPALIFRMEILKQDIV